eukprot:364682-Chlamydomonas_euryale.AAC.2
MDENETSRPCLVSITCCRQSYHKPALDYHQAWLPDMAIATNFERTSEHVMMPMGRSSASVQ